MSLRDEYVTISEAQKELGITRQTLYRWINSGKLASERIGHNVLISKPVVVKLRLKLMTQFVANLSDDAVKDLKFILGKRFIND